MAFLRYSCAGPFRDRIPLRYAMSNQIVAVPFPLVKPNLIAGNQALWQSGNLEFLSAGYLPVCPVT